MSKSLRRTVLATIALATVPLFLAAADPTPNLVGKWSWSWKDGDGKSHTQTLDVESKDGQYIGHERRGDEPAVKVNDLKVDGKRVRYFVIRGDQTITYDGNFGDANTINGKVTVAHEGQNDEYGWTARREGK